MVPSTNGIASLESGVPQLIPRCADTSLRSLENVKKGGKSGANGHNVSGSPTESLSEKCVLLQAEITGSDILMAAVLYFVSHNMQKISDRVSVMFADREQWILNCGSVLHSPRELRKIIFFFSLFPVTKAVSFSLMHEMQAVHFQKSATACVQTQTVIFQGAQQCLLEARAVLRKKGLFRERY